MIRLDKECRIVRQTGMDVDETVEWLERLFGTEDRGGPGSWVLTDVSGNYRPHVSDVHAFFRLADGEPVGLDGRLPVVVYRMMVRPDKILLFAIEGDRREYRTPTGEEMVWLFEKMCEGAPPLELAFGEVA